MDWGYKFESLQEKITALQDEVTALGKAYAEAVEFTLHFLEVCEKYNLSLVSVGKATTKIEGSIHFPFRHSGSVFADGQDEDGLPTIWRVVKELDISGGAGNKGQHQINCSAKMVDGVYELKDGKWRKLEL